MQGVKYIIVVARRDFAEEYEEFFHAAGAKSVIRNFCRGSTSDSVLNALGLERVERIMFRTLVTDKCAEEIRKGLLRDMRITDSGNGFYVSVPVDSIGGNMSKNYFLGEEEIKKEGVIVEEKSKFVLLITIADKGNVDLIMDAAKSAGAKGGTVVSGKGTGTNIAKFFGAVISEEKEMVYIVATRDTRDAIMKAIMEKAGKDSDAHGVVFSLPVEEVAGINRFAE
ncbi:MAG: P-II family nitrogen regulator [Clostridia bacterium]|nr:P-II family nitrogen regulator [Clostridia bacterium]